MKNVSKKYLPVGAKNKLQGDENMYGKGKLYKFQLSNGIFYNGYILDEDGICIQVKTIRDEFIVLSKKEITQALLMGDSHE